MMRGSVATAITNPLFSRHIYKSYYEKIAERMSKTGEVVLFPREEILSKAFEQRLDELTKWYVETLYAALHLLAGDALTKEDLDEITQLLEETYWNAFEKAVDQLEL